MLSEFTVQDVGAIPDVIGWRSNGWSVLVECKRSREDFRADAKKAIRASGWGGGQERWYFAPRGIIPKDEVPKEWGLAVFDTQVRVQQYPPASRLLPFDEQVDIESVEARALRSQIEIRMTVSALRRLSDGRNVPGLVNALRPGCRDPEILDLLQKCEEEQKDNARENL